MNTKTPESALVMQFAKWPEPGRVKTRLTPLLGEQGALEAHVALSLAVLENLADSGQEVRFLWDRPLADVPAASHSILSRIEALGVRQGTQEGDVLGERMEAALADALNTHSKAIVVGSDCPSVDAQYVQQAVQALNEADVVLGPSDDGGYVLIGARKHLAGMLADVSWGTDRALEETLARLESVGLSCVQLPARWDVDEPEDWQRFIRQFPDYHRLS
ncbi:TIGR04282 family arsenosugar biosynthesis glycosyltransferase [Marinobacter sp. CHS3-4]|uniref:TIGR04282 family arsenosugar biosynthesis glycosyltransferase n=1 Tax=Marinobacter sp. CHS3-4 TaxID=3045174 RepID=UPI0024B564BE|nr:TIGR04282 family arsenosugar biosynthesis glycosyltransferase [Marinobacter sp. CHS3-4]MDI9245146.1 TIGR04282 family arsenosugar biosynthesis glycosyltransferase [Marinobacter sp. CHS3-4]